MSAITNYLENKLIDQMFRAQGYTFPTTLYFALFTADPDDAGGGTEVTVANGYNRVAMTPNMTNFSGTQGTGTTVASSGTSGTTYNNVPITFGSPVGGNWGVITAMGVYDAASAGNLLFWGLVTPNKTVNNGDAAPSFAANAWSFQLDTV